jgi:nicotinate phosphoribosyltransferase
MATRKKTKYATDAYMFSMGLKYYIWNILMNMGIEGRFEFKDRTNHVFQPGFAEKLWERIFERSELSPDPYIANYLMQKWEFMNQEFIRWYDQVFFHDPSQIDLTQKDGKLRLIVEGPLHTGAHHEIPVLRDIACLITTTEGRRPKQGWQQEAKERARILYEKGVAYAEGGGRRPFGEEVHRESLEIYAGHRKHEGFGGLTGTSWVEYASDLNLMPMGTMAHQYVQVNAGLYGYENANHMAMQGWVDTYGKRLGYYLPDTFTTDVALRDFNHYFANLFEGTRHDSGDPFKYADKMIDHYRKLGIKSEKKSIIFSNSVRSIDEILELNGYRPEEFMRRFLLGGFITNNVGWDPYNMVLKLVAIRVRGGEWIDLCKLSDEKGKVMGKPEEVAKCLKVLRLGD